MKIQMKILATPKKMQKMQISRTLFIFFILIIILIIVFFSFS